MKFGRLSSARQNTHISSGHWEDQQLGPVPRLPGGYEEFDRPPGRPKLQIVRIVDERWQLSADGTRSRENLVNLKDSSGIKQHWVADYGIIAGDLVYDFHRRKREGRLHSLEDEENDIQVFQTDQCDGVSTDLSGGMSQNANESCGV